MSLLRHVAEGCWVIALYNTVAVRDRVVQILRSRLHPVPVYEFSYALEDSPQAYFRRIPIPPEERAVVCLYDAAQAGPTFWGRLELEREALATYPHGLVFWLTPAEYEQAVRNAPHFWSQRSGVFDFTVADRLVLAQLQERIAGEPVRYADQADWERLVRLYKTLLREYALSSEPPVEPVAELHNKLAWLYFGVGDYEEARKHAREALALAEQEQRPSRAKAGALLRLGILAQAQGDYAEARRLYGES
ncbi:MAG: tetratricopeptide repeat protein, partial [Anaerolineae bacterium]